MDIHGVGPLPAYAPERAVPAANALVACVLAGELVAAPDRERHVWVAGVALRLALPARHRLPDPAHQCCIRMLRHLAPAFLCQRIGMRFLPDATDA